MRKLVFASAEPSLCSMLRVWPSTPQAEEPLRTDDMGYTLPPQTLSLDSGGRAYPTLDPGQYTLKFRLKIITMGGKQS